MSGVEWNGDRVVWVETDRLQLRPIRSEDFFAYEEVFNPFAMQNFRGSFNEARFGTWLERWQTHNFSALAVVYTVGGRTDLIGHAILGHGDYTPETSGCSSEMAFILRQEFWNTKHKTSKSVGKEGLEGVGTEVALAIMTLAKEIFAKGFLAPADLNDNPPPQDQEIYTEKGKPRAVMLPLAEVTATCSADNVASQKILRRAFKVDEEGGGTEEQIAGDKPGLRFRIAAKSL